MYKCSKCGMAVIVHNGKIHKGCQCVAPVTAEMSAKADGKGGVKVGARKP